MQSTDLSTVFSALADPTRRAILARLQRGEAPVKDLAEPFAMTGPAITKHLKVLERAGLISRGREGRERPCKLAPHGFDAAADWLEQYRTMWEEQLDRLGEFLKSSVPKAGVPRVTPPTRKRPRTTTARRRKNG